MISQRAVDGIESSDTDELLRVVDGYCETGDWAHLVELRSRCQEALTRGKQLWGVDEHIRYRLALEAPPEFAGPVLDEGAARFALGPLPEVAASTKTWAEIEPFLSEGPHRLTFAAERAIHGDLGVDEIPDLPNRILSWEPRYPTATYKSDKLEAPSPKPRVGDPDELPPVGVRINDVESEGALADIVLPWTTESNGTCQVATVEGTAGQAIRALGLSKAALIELTPQEAFSWMGWAGASGGAHGRRRGAAAGRYGAWWVVATLADLDWPPEPAWMEEAVSSLGWYWYDDAAPVTGWQLRLAIEDPRAGLAWAISANDSAD